MAPSPDVLSPTKWSLDGVEFAVATALGTTIRGRFAHVAGSYEVGPHSSTIELAVDPTSIDAGSGIWDGLLVSAESRALSGHPQVRFTSTDVRAVGNGTLRVEGLIEGAGRVEPVAFDAAVKQVGDGLRLEAAATIDRHRLGESADGFAVFLPATARVTMHLSPSRHRCSLAR
jgi:polyisoprenoid-binding protein YceI